ncbi:N(2)-acetyl-L-2,4-diaminobutanoate deacetylase DoeB [Limibacillus halophilus]|jgi:N-alpha-acetyl-L-2,4-diaminobutyrate deacetylase
MKPSPITATIDFEKDGVQHGFLKLPHSHDGSAWGSIMIPVACIKQGVGPTALLTGGNHGDEYEGPLAILDLASRLKAEEVSGRVILVPGMNYPAVKAGTRTSPIDRGNLNRSFPGRPDGSVTEKIADYFQRVLLPLADLVCDVHSGGKTLDFVPFAAAHILPDKAQQARCVAAMEAFAAPYSMMLLEIDAVGMYDTAAEEMGKTFVSTELGGGGTARAATVAIARRGLKNLLVHAGILEGEVEAAQSVKLDMPDGSCYITSEVTGLLEMALDLGEVVRKGEVVARIRSFERTGAAPVELRAECDGILAGRHFPGLISAGDTVAVIGVPV